MIQNFGCIDNVPQCNELIDIALSKTNRKTPTVVRSTFQIQRIRSFYIRKVQFSASEFMTRLDKIVKNFPVLDNIHPFYSDIINILYDRDHYKMALGQLNTVKHKIELILKNHVRLLKFGDTLYRCKELKKAALGKMATTIKKLSEPLKYLEEVRQHISRLPSIDTTARTIVIAGFPNIGKSSFMNKISKAHVDVKPYAFTTTSLYVGHFDYKDLKWQVLDTPGILDHQLSERNAVEMQTITALAHLKSAVLFFIDLSESCGYSIGDQIQLYNNLTPLLDSQLLIVFSKADLCNIEMLGGEAADRCDEVRRFIADKTYVEMSVVQDYNVDVVRNTICDMLLKERIEMKQPYADSFMHRIKPTDPAKGTNQIGTERSLGRSEHFGAPDNEVYVCEHKYDTIPEFYNGKNVVDFIDAKIVDNLERVTEIDNDEVECRYDILNKQERDMFDACNNARILAVMQSERSKRSTIPSRWKNKVDSNGELVVRKAVPVVKKEKPHVDKKAKPASTGYCDMKPKHAYRKAGRKHGKIVR